VSRLFALALLLFVSHGAAASGPAAPTTSPGTLEETLKSIARERILQFDRGDKTRWSSYVADGYFIATPSGPVRSKEQVTDGFAPPPVGYRDVFSFEDVHVTRDGDTAVMSYIIDEYEFWDERKYVIPQLRKTDTFVLRNNHWLLLASQETFVPPRHTRISIDPSRYEEYVGRYRLMRSLSYDVTVDGGNLILQEVGKPQRKVLWPMADDVFFSEGESGQIIFVKNDAGRVTHFLIHDNGYEIQVPKVD
jgi:hypothetical protein